MMYRGVIGCVTAVSAVVLACGCGAHDRDDADRRIGWQPARIMMADGDGREGESVPIRTPQQTVAKPGETLRLWVDVQPDTEFLQRFTIFMSDPEGIIERYTPHVDVPAGYKQFEFEVTVRDDAKGGKSAVYVPANQNGDSKTKGAIVVEGAARASRTLMMQRAEGGPPRALGESVPITPCDQGIFMHAAPGQTIDVWVSLETVVVGADQKYSITFLKGDDQIVAPAPKGATAKVGTASFPVQFKLKGDANGEIVMEVTNPDVPSIGARYRILILQPVAIP